MCCVKVCIINVKDHCYTLSWGWEANAVCFPKPAGWLVRLLSFEAVLIQVYSSTALGTHGSTSHPGSTGICSAGGFAGEGKHMETSAQGLQVQSCAGKKNQVPGERRGAALLRVQHWNTPAPPRAALELQQQHLLLATALWDRQDGSYSSLWFTSNVLLQTQAQLSPSLTYPLLSPLSLVFSPTIAQSTTQPWSDTLFGATVPLTLLCVTPFPPHPYSLIFSLKSTPVSSNNQKSFLLQKSPTMHLLLSAAQRYSSERSRNIPLKLLLSPVEVGCSALLQKTSSENSNKTQKKTRPQSQQTFLNIVA